ncbi:uncharacterized protein BX664DRAFT_361224 [Halteromyces radiatus]|uniref:uncharacterized protein n=1 Tax=Halteromyces radiatus TaxID=101107 RepID=UPI00221FA694|nr:uncharacterized protein BX664DRAFT_361224 [Halteromyces radiatus]KAI8082943.1 hypothetical protein BX664DRAFT_361224 [Halteromyces radiatus]
MSPLFQFDSCPRDDATLIRYSKSTSTSRPLISSSSPLSPRIPQPSSLQSSSNHLQAIVDQYQSQPELLKMILNTKLEEDKRKAEEARLRAKELDIYMSFHGRNDEDDDRVSTPPLSPHQHPCLSKSSPSSSSSSLPTSPPPPSSSLTNGRKSISYSIDSSSTHPLDTSFPYFKPISITPEHQDDISKKMTGRKRRSMQAVTKIVETKDPLYKDDYLWKNNGNTIQRKTGYKSTYYKCSNASKGCPVNKTILFQSSSGDCIIKYRGHHLPFCGKVEHVYDL